MPLRRRVCIRRLRLDRNQLLATGGVLLPLDSGQLLIYAQFHRWERDSASTENQLIQLGLHLVTTEHLVRALFSECGDGEVIDGSMQPPLLIQVLLVVGYLIKKVIYLE